MNKKSFRNELDQPIGNPLSDWSPPPFPKREILPGRFCRLEPTDRTRHGRELFEALNHSTQNWTYLPYGPFESEVEFLNWIEENCLGRDPQFYTIIRQEDEKAVGVASYLRIAPEQGSIEAGHIHFSNTLKRTPVASEAMFLMLNYAFDLGYRRYEWKCDALNTASCSAAQRLGFSFEGIFRQAMVYKQRNRDTAWYSIIDTEWPTLQKAHQQWLAPENFDEGGIQKTSLGDLISSLRSKSD